MRTSSRVMLPRGLLSRHEMPFTHRGRAETAEERIVVRGNNKEERTSATSPFELSRLVRIHRFLSQFKHIECLFRNADFPSFCLCLFVVCIVSACGRCR